MIVAQSSPGISCRHFESGAKVEIAWRACVAEPATMHSFEASGGAFCESIPTTITATERTVSHIEACLTQTMEVDQPSLNVCN
jgi:hypothetical protein